MNQIDRTEIGRRFRHYPPNVERVNRHIEVRQACRQLAERLAELLPESREKSLAITATEEAMMWANAAIARQPDSAQEE